jgi:hypothetical protein
MCARIQAAQTSGVAVAGGFIGRAGTAALREEGVFLPELRDDADPVCAGADMATRRLKMATNVCKARGAVRSFMGDR